MFMFREKKTAVNSTKGFQKEAKKFQKVVTEINTKIKPEALTMEILEGAANENGIEVEFLRDTFETFLRDNALKSVRKIKAKGDYSILDLERTVEKYGFELDDLNITYFSED